jgi:hypothetical protein
MLHPGDLIVGAVTVRGHVQPTGVDLGQDPAQVLGHLGDLLDVQAGGDRQRAHLTDRLPGSAHPSGLRDRRPLPVRAAAQPPTLRVDHPHAVVVELVELAESPPDQHRAARDDPQIELQPRGRGRVSSRYALLLPCRKRCMLEHSLRCFQGVGVGAQRSRLKLGSYCGCDPFTGPRSGGRKRDEALREHERLILIEHLVWPLHRLDNGSGCTPEYLGRLKVTATRRLVGFATQNKFEIAIT